MLTEGAEFRLEEIKTYDSSTCPDFGCIICNRPLKGRFRYICMTPQDCHAVRLAAPEELRERIEASLYPVGLACWKRLPEAVKEHASLSVEDSMDLRSQTCLSS